jgi:predicted alpha/beta-hydrolase family hydrolase
MAEIRVRVGEGSVSASWRGEGSTAVVLGHGAGSNRDHPFLVALAEAIAGSGRQAVLYNFPYKDAGRGLPDKTPVLEATARAVADHARQELEAKRLVLGGRSMGGRIASQIVADGAEAAGLIFLGYPLHPPRKPLARRDRHLPRIEAPMLFVQGTRDDFARPDLLAALLERLGRKACVHQVEDADHSFAVRKRSGRSAQDVTEEVHAAVLGWLSARGL